MFLPFCRKTQKLRFPQARVPELWLFGATPRAEPICKWASQRNAEQKTALNYPNRIRHFRNTNTRQRIKNQFCSALLIRSETRYSTKSFARHNSRFPK
jgi:hypothetical protein